MSMYDDPVPGHTNLQISEPISKMARSAFLIPSKVYLFGPLKKSLQGNICNLMMMT